MNKIIYELIEVDSIGGKIEVLNATFPDGTVSTIPADPANSDYQAYLASLEA